MPVPRRRRLSQLTAHTARLVPEDVVVIEGMPVTSVERTTYELGRWLMDGHHPSASAPAAVWCGPPTSPAAPRRPRPPPDHAVLYATAAARWRCTRPAEAW